MAVRGKQSDTGQLQPHPIDVLAGRNLRIARLLAGRSQESLGDAVGVTFQQIQKYENARNRMSISRAWELASVLGISITVLFEDAEWGPTGEFLQGKGIAEWMLLYTRALNVGMLSEIVGLAEKIVHLREPLSPEETQC